jgi:hypothetical protein
MHPPRAFVFRLEGGRLYCSESGLADRTVQPGERFTAGSAEIVVCTPDARYVPPPSVTGPTAPIKEEAKSQTPSAPTVPASLRLVLSAGSTIDLLAGRTIRVGEIPGLAAGPTDSTLSKVDCAS